MSRPPQTRQTQRPGRLKANHVWSALCLLVLLVGSLAGCGTSPAPTGISVAATTAVQPSNSPTPSPVPTRTGLPTVPVATRETVTAGFSATPSRTATPTSTSTETPTATSTATATSTRVSSGVRITPTETVTPTITPTLTPSPVFSPTPLPTPAFSGNIQHILLLGLDSTRNLWDQNSDVIMVAVVNKDTKQVSLLSIPRDLWVYIPTYGWSRINVAHKVGFRTDYPGAGAGLLMDTIRINLGIPLDHWLRIDFDGFANVVDELGGIDITVACPVNLRFKPPQSEEEEEMILEAGVHHMDGATALRYVRTRRDSSDFDRAQRQQKFLKAVWGQFKSPDIILKIPGLWSALRDSFQTDLNLGDVLSLVPVALDLEPQRIRSRYIGDNQTIDWINAEGWQVLLPDYDKIPSVVASLYAPPPSNQEQAAGENARIQLRNGTYRHQLAKIGADQLRWYGLDIVDTGLADNPNYQQTQIIVFNDKPQALNLLVQLLRVQPENVVHQPDPSQPADIQVILGNDYDPCR